MAVMGAVGVLVEVRVVGAAGVGGVVGRQQQREVVDRLSGGLLLVPQSVVVLVLVLLAPPDACVLVWGLVAWAAEVGVLVQVWEVVGG